MIFNRKLKSIIFIFFTLVIVASLIVFLLQNIQTQKSLLKRSLDQQILNTVNKQKEFQKIIDNTTAQGVIIYDLRQDKVLASKNIDQTYSLASLTKIVTAVAVYEKDKNLLNEIRSMLKTSSNPEAEKLALTFGPDKEKQVEYMNNFTKPYNLYFRNVSGLDINISTSTDENTTSTENRIAGGEGKPVDLINFIKEYYPKYPEIFDQTIIDKDNTNTVIDDLSFLSISKTGFTNLSGGNLFVSVQLGLGHEIFILVLNSTEKNRFVDVQNIVNFLLQSSI